MYNTDFDKASSAVDLFATQTLKTPGAGANGFPGGQITDSTSNLPVSTTRLVLASGGTFTGSALYDPNGKNAGATYEIETDSNGAVAKVKVIDKGPNVGSATETIIFNAATLNASFGVTNITGSVTVTTAATDFEAPTDSNGIYEGTQGSFGLYGSTTDASGKFDLKVELASQAVGNIITFTGVPSGTVLPIIVRKVDVTNSTATSLVALY